MYQVLQDRSIQHGSHHPHCPIWVPLTVCGHCTGCPHLSHRPDRRTTIPPTDWSQSEPAKTQPTGPRAGRAQRSLHWQLLQPLLQDRRSLSRCRRRHTGVADQGAGSLVHGLLPKIHPSAQQGNRYRGSGNSKERLCDKVTKLEPTLNVWGSPYTTPD